MNLLPVRAGEPVGRRFGASGIGILPIVHILLCVEIAVKAPLCGAMPQLFGAKLRYLRNQQSLTQGELARLLSLASYTYVHRLEANQRSPALQLVLQIAVVFDQPTDYLLRDSMPIEAASKADIKPFENQKSSVEQFGAKIKALRNQAGWTQFDLARKLGLARQGYISNLELGRKLPSLELALQIAELFQVTTDYLLRDDIAASHSFLD